MKPTRNDKSSPAEVIIFPGVRVEHRDFSLSDRLAPQRRRAATPADYQDFESL
ncbi:MAG: hypothetical protein HYX36_16735 [Rhizobiales bacterium]|nr:hypothetical protein [Hyphomicrobiales bacterium]